MRPAAAGTAPWTPLRNSRRTLIPKTPGISRTAGLIDIAAVPAEIAHNIANRIREAAKMGDVLTLNTIADDIKPQSELCIPLSNQIRQLAEDFDLEGIQELADSLDAC